MRKVIGSSPISSTIKKAPPDWVVPFLFWRDGDGLKPIAVKLSGGQFLPPVQTLVATLIHRFRCRHYPLYPNGVSLILLPTGIEPIGMELSGGQFLPPVQTLVASLIHRFRLPALKLIISPIRQVSKFRFIGLFIVQHCRGGHWPSAVAAQGFFGRAMLAPTIDLCDKSEFVYICFLENFVYNKIIFNIRRP